MTRLGAFLAIPLVYQSYYNGALACSSDQVIDWSHSSHQG